MGGDDDEAEEGEDEDAGDIDDAPTLVEYEVDVYFLCLSSASHMLVGLKDLVWV